MTVEGSGAERVGCARVGGACDLAIMRCCGQPDAVRTRLSARRVRRRTPAVRSLHADLDYQASGSALERPRTGRTPSVFDPANRGRSFLTVEDCRYGRPVSLGHGKVGARHFVQQCAQKGAIRPCPTEADTGMESQ